MRCVERVRYPSNRGPNRETRPPRGPFLSEKGFLTPPSFFSRTHAIPFPLLYRSALPTCCAHLTPVLSLITWACPCCVVAGEPTHGMMGMASRANILDSQV